MIENFTLDTDANPENMNMLIEGINKNEEDITAVKKSVEGVSSQIGQLTKTTDFNNHKNDNAAHGIGNKLSKNGDTMTGYLGIGITATRPLHVKSSQWDNNLGSGVILENTNNVGAGITLSPLSSIINSVGWGIYAAGPSGAAGDGNLGFWAHGTGIILTVLRDAGLKLGQISILQGTGSPEGTITAIVGSLYLRRDGGTNTTLYVKQSGSGNTGWVAK